TRPALFAPADHAAPARNLVHADLVGRGALRAAGLARLVPARRRGLGAHRRDDLGAVRRRAHRGGDQAGLSRDPGAAREAQARACAGARARAHAVNRPSRLRYDPEKWTPVFGQDHAQTRSWSVMTIRRKVRASFADLICAARWRVRQ